MANELQRRAGHDAERVAHGYEALARVAEIGQLPVGTLMDVLGGYDRDDTLEHPLNAAAGLLRERKAVL